MKQNRDTKSVWRFARFSDSATCQTTVADRLSKEEIDSLKRMGGMKKKPVPSA